MGTVVQFQWLAHSMATMKWPDLIDITITSCIAAVLVFAYRLMNVDSKKLRLPPGPPAWPVVGNLFEIGTWAHRSLMELSRNYGPIMYLRMGSVPMVVVSSPELAKEVLQNQDQVFCSRPKTIVGEVFFQKQQDVGFSPYGEHFRHVRRIFIEEILTTKRVAAFEGVRKAEIRRTVQNMVEESYGGKPLHMYPKLMEITLNVTTRIVFNQSFYGKTFSSGGRTLDVAREFYRLTSEFSAIGGSFMIGEFIPFLRNLDLGGWEARVSKLSKQFENIVLPILKERRQFLASNSGQQSETKPFIDVLMEHPADKSRKLFTDEQMLPLVKDLLLAGSEPSSSTMVWILAEIMQNPEVLRELENELDAVVGKERLVEESDLSSLTYLRAVVSETLRMHPSLPMLFPHFSMKATKIGDYDVPAGTRLFVNVYAITRDPAVWENPLKFDPKRFLSSKVNLAGRNYELLAYGSGRRSCPGMSFSLYLMELAVATLIQTTELSLPSGMSPQDLDMNESPGVSSSKRIPLKLLVTPRPSTFHLLKSN